MLFLLLFQFFVKLFFGKKTRKKTPECYNHRFRMNNLDFIDNHNHNHNHHHHHREQLVRVIKLSLQNQLHPRPCLTTTSTTYCHLTVTSFTIINPRSQNFESSLRSQNKATPHCLYCQVSIWELENA